MFIRSKLLNLKSKYVFSYLSALSLWESLLFEFELISEFQFLLFDSGKSEVGFLAERADRSEEQIYLRKWEIR